MSLPSKNPFIIEHQSRDLRDPLIPSFKRNQELGSFFPNESKPTLWLGQVISGAKLKIACGIILLIFLILISRLFTLQLINRDNYLALAEGNRIRADYLLPQRGIIFDRWHKPMVENVSSFSLYLNPSILVDQIEAKEKLKNFLINLEISGQKLSLAEIDELISSQSQLPLLVKEDVPYEQALKLIIESSSYPCLNVVAEPRRHYLAKEFSTAHLIGYTNRITVEEKDSYIKQGYQLVERVGRAGIEEVYQADLRGTPGERRIEVDSLGREKKVIAESQAQPGKNLVLAVDSELQDKIAEIFKKSIKNQAAAAVAIDPNNGKVRALVSWPTFDNNLFSHNLTGEDYQKIIGDPLKPLINRAISGEYPSGSTIKILIAGAALEEKLIDKNSTVLSSGGVWYDKWFFPDWKAGGHGLTNVIKAIAQSVNTFFYYLGLENFDNHRGLGLEKLTSYFKKFGLGKVLDIDLPGEKDGFVPSAEWKEQTKNEIWYPGDTLHLAIGQGDLLVTPLQIASLTSVIANRGQLYQPQLIEFIENPLDGKKEMVEPKIFSSQLIKKENLDVVSLGMRETILSGSARSLSVLPISLAGKTGTAQVGGNQKSHAWFTSFAPYDNPELVLTILVEHGGEGSEVAVPIAREIWQWYAENRAVKH